MIQGITLVTPRSGGPLLDFVEHKFAGDPSVRVVRDRRYGQRRRHLDARGDERRQGDRRGGRGFAVYLTGIDAPAAAS